MPSSDRLRSYDRKKAACGDTFLCHHCEQSLSAVAFEQHAKDCLGLNPRTHCVWCLGKTSWKSGSKGLHRDHLHGCFGMCPFRQARPAAAPPTPGVVYHYVTKQPQPDTRIFLGPLDDDEEDLVDPFNDLPSQYEQSFVLDTHPEPLCRERDWFDHDRLPDLPDLAYELFNLLDLPPPALSYQDAHLTLAVACMQTFLELRHTHDFVHCMVRAVAMARFVEALQGTLYGRKIRMLPFSCWCNGGNYKEASHRMHRHMILTMPKGDKAQFQKYVWGKLRNTQDRPRDASGNAIVGYQCHLKRAITEPMHLANAMGYLSDRKSRCNGALDEKQSRRRSTLKQNHFWILTSLPANFRLPLVMQWDGGIMQLIHQQFRYMQPVDLVALTRCLENGKWKIPVKELPGLIHRLVMPVAKTFRPMKNPTYDASEAFLPERRSDRCLLYLADGRKLYFEEDLSLADMDDAAWGRVQAEAGNVFFDQIFEQKWTPGQFQQKCLNAIDFYRVQYEAQRDALEKKFEEKECDLHRDRKKLNEALVAALREEPMAAEAAVQAERARSVVAALKEEHAAAVQSERARSVVAALKEEHAAAVQAERARWEAIVAKERAEKAELKEALEACRRAQWEAEVAHLKETVASLRTELAKKDAELVVMKAVLEKADAERVELRKELEKLRLEAVQRESQTKVRSLEEAYRAKDAELQALKAEALKAEAPLRIQSSSSSSSKNGGGVLRGGERRRRSLDDEAVVTKRDLERKIDRMEGEMDQLWLKSKRRCVVKIVAFEKRN